MTGGRGLSNSSGRTVRSGSGPADAASSFKKSMTLTGGVFFVLCLFFSGCTSLGSYNPATGRSEFIFISTPEEVDMGDKLHTALDKEYKILPSSLPVSQRVERIGRTVAAVSDRQDFAYHFYVIEKDEMNAFTVPGGSIYIFSNLVNKLGQDENIAAVLAHEIGHCAAKHTVKKFQAAMSYNLISSLLLSQVGEGGQQLASMSTGTIMNLIFSAYGRQDEYEADKLGVKYLLLAGIDPQAMIGAFNVLKQEESKGQKIPIILRTHPYLDDRIEKVKQEIQQIKNQY